MLLYGDLRGFTKLSDSAAPEAVVEALDAWFDRVAGAVHAFGGEVLKFIGDGVLAIFPIGERPPSSACDAAMSAVRAARAGMAHLDEARSRRGQPPFPFGMAPLGDMLWGNIGTPTGWTSPPSALPSTSSVASRDYASPWEKAFWSQAQSRRRRPARFVPLGEHILRGIEKPCAVFALPED